MLQFVARSNARNFARPKCRQSNTALPRSLQVSEAGAADLRASTRALVRMRPVRQGDPADYASLGKGRWRTHIDLPETTRDSGQWSSANGPARPGPSAA